MRRLGGSGVWGEECSLRTLRDLNYCGEVLTLCELVTDISGIIHLYEVKRIAGLTSWCEDGGWKESSKNNKQHLVAKQKA